MSEAMHPSGLSREKIAELRTLAAEAAEKAYAPYSKFRVGSLPSSLKTAKFSRAPTSRTHRIGSQYARSIRR